MASYVLIRGRDRRGVALEHDFQLTRRLGVDFLGGERTARAKRTRPTGWVAEVQGGETWWWVQQECLSTGGNETVFSTKNCDITRSDKGPA